MKIVFTGGGTGGHFYPIIAIAEEVNKIVDTQKIVSAKLYYFSDSPYDKTMLFENGLLFEKVPAGKFRLYFSIRNFFDIFKVGYGVVIALFKLYKIYPDVVVGKGGYASLPTLVAARMLRIPVIIHESDTVPGKVSKWAGKFARRIALSYPDAGEFFPPEKTAWTGQPVREAIKHKAREGAFEYLELDHGLPVVMIVGGSQGAQLLNNAVLDALPRLLQKFQVIHQTGTKNFKEVTETAGIVLEKSEYKNRYKPFPYLNDLATKMSAGASSLIVSRAGSMIFEIASWGVPSILIPITNSNGDHQRKNAFAYARSGACMVTEESNLTATVLATDIENLLSNKEKLQKMADSATAFFKTDSAHVIAQEVINIALSHEE
jgi:UDP-N-acetylglucosamine--N-acetylmuramyl-(pentapeptide) pyrophosphoryl-undecaprenol N-acetylglucosamine transferase